jgi:ribosomal protein S18 acetylase RimI-like enzyme
MVFPLARGRLLASLGVPTPFVVRALEPSDAEACDAVVATLPYHFGSEAGLRECAEAVRSQNGLVAAIDRDIVGFVTEQRYGSGTAEMTWLAVRADHRRQGIGRTLTERLVRDLAADGVRILFALTLGPSTPDDVEDGYEGTRRFYERMGFLPLREFTLASWDDPALVLVRPLT